MKPFDMHEDYVRPYWQGGVITDESILPLYKKGESGELSIRLMNDIKRVLRVQKATRDVVYTEGKDYFVRDGLLVIPEGSAIPVMSWETYNPAEPPDAHSFKCKDGGYLIFGEGNYFHSQQYVVTYESASNCFDGHYVPEKSPLLEKSIAKLGHDTLKLAFYGDSITFGCNASGLLQGLPPYMPIYPKLTAEVLERRGYSIHYYNPSIGGKSTPWGRDEATFYFDEFQPDLTVIAFGMNDGTGRLPVEDYIANTRSIIHTIRAKRPDAEFILVTTTLPNAISTFVGLQEAYQAPLTALAAEEGCALLDMTELHRTILTRKPYHDMTGNNINHPSDFLARVYAQGVLALLGQ
ncbi:MAG: SGNH/GDSL hydrolase family protein [Clostridia bacterium]|nr:SGNH/GDSL hydrolase family protein [Clostridia bacterium]